MNSRARFERVISFFPFATATRLCFLESSAAGGAARLRDRLDELADTEGGRRLIVNLSYSVHSGHLDAALVQDIVLAAIAGGASSDQYHPYLKSLGNVIFAEPDRYQYLGPSPSAGDGLWMTIKSMGDLVLFMREAGIRRTEWRTKVGVPSPSGSHRNMSERYYKRFADAISDTAGSLTFMLARRFKHPQRKGTRRPVPCWLSRWCSFPEPSLLRQAPSGDVAGRLRDWLGLGHYGAGDPLFIVRARRGMPVDSLSAKRPTALDGFDNPLFKHKTGPANDKVGYGSTADVRQLRSTPPTSRDVEGGPELVSAGLAYNPADFSCTYLGKAPPLDYDLCEPHFHHRLLRPGDSFEDVLVSLERICPARGP